jgi:hypothetical protein
MFVFGLGLSGWEKKLWVVSGDWQLADRGLPPFLREFL